jgi:hypothetical protein
MSNCRLEFVRELASGEYLHRCPTCGVEAESNRRDPSMRRQKCAGISPPGGRPGTELRRIFDEMGVKPTAKCRCKQFARKMDYWGIDGCCQRTAEIVAHLQEHAKEFGLSTWAAAGWSALWQGKPRSLEGLVQLAIDRAREKASGQCSAAL